MSKLLTRLFAFFLAVTTLLLCACGTDADTPSKGNEKSDYPSPAVFYDPTPDAPFLPKDIFDPSMYTNGLVPFKVSNTEFYVEVKGKNDSSKALVFKGEFGKCYEVKCPKGMSGLRAAVVSKDPRKAETGSKINYSTSLLYYGTQPSADTEPSFMYVAREVESYLVVYTGRDAPTLQVLERTMLQDTDTSGPWFTPPTIGSVKGSDGGAGTFADYHWSSDEVLNNLYEPYRAKYPEYISREHIGRDHSDKYDMYGYVFEPEQYKACLFITSGVHGNEQTAYLALAAFMGLVCESTPDGDPLLWFLRNHVKFVVVPIVNVWSVSETQIRKNSKNIDLNRDWDIVSQQENRNVRAFFEKYVSEYDVAIDFHNAYEKVRSLYYNFINYTDNAVANYKTTNHMYHRFMELGICSETPHISKIPGSYVKSDVYLEGPIWNKYKIPSMTVEHANYGFCDNPKWGSSSEMTLAVEVFGNFIIQNSLFFAQD